MVPAGAAPDRHLFVVADSVALGAVPAIRAAFAGWDVAVEGHQGIFTDAAAELAWAHRDEIGPVAVVATGYNYPVWNPPLFDGWIDQMMGRLVAAGARHVVWLTPDRLADTRATGARLAAGGVVAVQVPPGAGRVVVTATAVDPAGAGYITAHPCGTPPPTASVLN